MSYIILTIAVTNTYLWTSSRMEDPHHCRLYNWLVQSSAIPHITRQVDPSKILQRIVVEVDSLALLEFDSYLGNCLVGNYPLFCSVLQEV